MSQYRYLPLLRSKTGEASALANLAGSLKSRLLPVIHLVEKPAARFAGTLIGGWSGRPLALDGLFNMDLTGTSSHFSGLFTQLGKGGVQVIPSVEYNADPKYAAAAKALVGKFAPGLVVKVNLAQLVSVDVWVSSQGWKQAEIDLVIDAGAIGGYDPLTFQAFVSATLASYKIGSKEWRSITLAASAAPKDLSAFARGRNLVPRLDWKLWQAISPNVDAKLDFGDYATTHPDLTEPPGIAMANAPVNARYTIDDEWIVLKGYPMSGVHGRPMDMQFRAHARTLSAEPKFGGLVSCWADGRIQQIGSGTSGPGNRPTWVSISLNRHLSLVSTKLP